MQAASVLLQRISHSVLILAGLSVCVHSTKAAEVNFETLNTGDTFGMGTHNPGETMVVQDGITVRLTNFQLGSFEDFNTVRINGPGTDSFATKHAFLDNIGLEFDLNAIAPITDVFFDYVEGGGDLNFAVNSGPIIELEFETGGMLSLENHPDLPPGITAMVDADSVHLSGAISDFLLAGQELALDNIVAVPEPTCLVLLAVGMGAGIYRRRSTKLIAK